MLRNQFLGSWFLVSLEFMNYLLHNARNSKLVTFLDVPFWRCKFLEPTHPFHWQKTFCCIFRGFRGTHKFGTPPPKHTQIQWRIMEAMEAHSFDADKRTCLKSSGSTPEAQCYFLLKWFRSAVFPKLLVDIPHLLKEDLPIVSNTQVRLLHPDSTGVSSDFLGQNSCIPQFLNCNYICSRTAWFSSCSKISLKRLTRRKQVSAQNTSSAYFAIKSTLPSDTAKRIASDIWVQLPLAFVVGWHLSELILSNWAFQWTLIAQRESRSYSSSQGAVWGKICWTSLVFFWQRLDSIQTFVWRL